MAKAGITAMLFSQRDLQVGESQDDHPRQEPGWVEIYSAFLRALEMLLELGGIGHRFELIG